MRKIMMILWAVLLISIGFVTTGLAQPYVGINAGVVFVEDSDLPIPDNPYMNELSYKTGYGLDLTFGHAYKNGLRAEFELAYKINSIDEERFVVSIPDVADFLFEIDGDVSSWGGLVNGYYDFPMDSAFKPFIGAGVGYVDVRMEIGDASESDAVFAYQAMAGCSYAVNSNVTFDLQYRYFATDDPDFDGFELDYATHNVMAGFRFAY